MRGNEGTKGSLAGKWILKVDLTPLRFLKALVAVSFLAFSYFKPPDGNGEGGSDKLEVRHFFLLEAAKYWGSHAVQVVYLSHLILS